MGTKCLKKQKILQRIELKCLEMKEMMYQRSEYLQYSAEEIENRVLMLRNMLIEKEGVDENHKENGSVNERSEVLRSPSHNSSCSSCYDAKDRKHHERTRPRKRTSRERHYRDSSSGDRSETRSPSIRRRKGSPSHLDKRRITSARKRPVPYHRPSPVWYSTTSSDEEAQRESL